MRYLLVINKYFIHCLY